MSVENIEYLAIREYLNYNRENVIINENKGYRYIQLKIEDSNIVILYNKKEVIKSIDKKIFKIDANKLKELYIDELNEFFYQSSTKEQESESKEPKEILKNIFGYDSFRGKQEEIIDSILNKKDTLVLMPTGGGKSLCYQVPALCSEGTAIIISPLISLMEDQVQTLKVLGVKAEYVNSSLSKEEYIDIMNNINDLKLLYISPERFNNKDFQKQLEKLNISFFAIDEAHCVSKWGHDFRPDYLNLESIKKKFKKPIIALTATADLNTREDIPERLLMKDYTTFVSSFDRPNIKILVKEKNNYKEQLLSFVEDFKDESGIVYCLSRKKVEEVSKFLSDKGFSSYPYHAGMNTKLRSENQERFIKKEKQIICCTNSFGMGIDKPNVCYVVHCDMPGSIEAYYQEIGRAGRDSEPAVAMMLYGMKDFVTRSHMTFRSQSDRKMQNIAKLNEMLAFCETLNCKREYLMDYFGNEKVECGNCTSCLSTSKSKDVTSIAKVLIKAIKDTREFYAAGYICSLLKGSKAKNIKEKHKSLESYDTFSGPEQELKKIIRQLLVMKVLEIDLSNDYNSLKVKKELEEEVLIKPYEGKEKKEKIIINTSLDYSEKEMYEQLRELRFEIAQEHNIAPYMVLHDKSLKQMAKKKPKTIEELAKLHGWGEKRLDAYGVDFVRFFNQD